MHRTVLEQKMISRVRRHLLTSFGGFAVAIGLMVVAGGAMRAIFGDTAPAWVRAFPVLGILLIPTIGFWSTYKNLRCPSCERLVVWQFSQNYSMFGATAPKTCAGCGEKIFADDIARRFRRRIVVFAAIGVGLGLVGAIASAMTGH